MTKKQKKNLIRIIIAVVLMVILKITEKPIPDKDKVNVLFDELTSAFEKEETTKEEIIAILKAYLPNFEHIDTGKSLDSKM